MKEDFRGCPPLCPQGGWRKATPFFLPVQGSEIRHSCYSHWPALRAADWRPDRSQSLLLSPKLGSAKPLFQHPQIFGTHLTAVTGTYLGMREVGAPLATSGSNADCPLPLLSWRLWERGQKPVVAGRQQRQGLPSQPGERNPAGGLGTGTAQTLLFSCHPIPRTEFSPVRILLRIFSPPRPVITDSHPKLPPPKHQQLHQLPAGQKFRCNEVFAQIH